MPTKSISGAVYSFFMVALLATSGTEAVASLFKWRALVLFHNIKAMLNDKVTGLATEVYINPAVNPRTTSGSFEMSNVLPSYIEPNSFANALLAALELDQPRLNELKGKSVKEVDDWIRSEVHQLQEDARLRGMLAHSIHRLDANLHELTVSIASWFAQAAVRISGAYKRQTQLSNFLIGFVVAIFFNVSPLTSTTMTGLPPPSPSPVNAIPPRPIVPAPTGKANSTSAPNENIQAPSTMGSENTASGDGVGVTRFWTSFIRTAGLLHFLGWLLTGLSTLLGAPFWFDILSRVCNVRGAGGPPPEGKIPASG